MDSIKTKLKKYVKDSKRRCIGEIRCVPEGDEFRIYVAWEWEDMAEEGFFGFLESMKTYPEISETAIDETCNYGSDIGNTEKMRKVFGYLF